MGLRISFFLNSRIETQIIVSKFSLAKQNRLERWRKENMIMGKWLEIIFRLYLLTCPRNIPQREVRKAFIEFSILH